MLVYYRRSDSDKWQPFLQICEPDQVSIVAILFSIAQTMPVLRLACRFPGCDDFSEPYADGPKLMSRPVPLVECAGLPAHG